MSRPRLPARRLLEIDEAARVAKGSIPEGLRTQRVSRSGGWRGRQESASRVLGQGVSGRAQERIAD
jgi:hypothetical protein